MEDMEGTMNTKLSTAQVKILDKLETYNAGSDMRPAGLSAQELGDYKNEKTYCGVTTPSCRTNLQKLEKLGLVKSSKSGRSTYYRRTMIDRPESAEEYKARKAAEEEAELRRQGKIATCQGCLRGICLHDEQDQSRRRMVRHGWVSGSPGDKHAWHEGQCLGTQEKPLEDDYKVALECMGTIMNQIGHAQEDLAYLLARPASITGTESKWNSETRRADQVAVSYDRDDTDMSKDSPSYYNKYENVLRSQIRQDRHVLRALCRDFSAYVEAVGRIWDNKDVAAVFSKAVPLIRELKEADEVKIYTWIQEAA
jgi:hypothetical protein